MTIRSALIISFFTCVLAAQSQRLTGVYKINDLIKRISQPDTIYVVNFWAVWCKPCIQELPAFDSLNLAVKAKAVKVLLVSIDFKEDAESKVNTFLQKKQINSECVLLDEINGNTFINKISSEWSGAIPATLFRKGKRKIFVEKKMHLGQLKKKLTELEK